MTFDVDVLPLLQGLGDRIFTNVLCETVIMHLVEPEAIAAVRRLCSLLAPGGTLYLSWRVGDGIDRRDDAFFGERVGRRRSFLFVVILRGRQLDLRARAWVRLSLSEAPSPRGCSPRVSAQEGAHHQPPRLPARHLVLAALPASLRVPRWYLLLHQSLLAWRQPAWLVLLARHP